MSRTLGRQDSDVAYQDGHFFASVVPSYVTTGAGATVTAPNPGQFGTSLPTASTAYVANIPLRNLIFRYGVQDFAQEFFGPGPIGAGSQGQAVGSPFTYSTGSSVAGSAVTVNVLSSVGFTVGSACLVDTVASGVQETAVISAIPNSTSVTFASLKNAHTTPFPIAQNIFTTPYQASGLPPFTGLSQLTPQTTPRPKGIQFKAIYPVYTITGAAATLHTIGLIQTTFTNNVALAAGSNIIASAANGLATATSANIYNTPIPVPVAQQTFRTLRFTEYGITWAITTGVGGSAVLYGVYFDIAFNYL